MREAAMCHGIYATFLAKPMENEPRSAMHIHQSLIDLKSGENLFAGDEPGQHSEMFLNYLGGLQKYVPTAMAFAPNVNSTGGWCSVAWRPSMCSGATTTAPAACAYR